MDKILRFTVLGLSFVSLFLSGSAFFLVSRGAARPGEGGGNLAARVQRLEVELQAIDEAVQELTRQAAGSTERDEKLLKLVTAALAAQKAP